MTFLLNDPADFRVEMIKGFVAANSEFVRPVTGGVVRANGTPPGEVAVVIGGGSGHYPAFAGLVGQGLAHGAAMGDVFASPSAHQIYSVAKSAATDAGVLFSYGNYAGDCLNFDQAQARLVAEGIPCRTIVVTDDIASASEDEVHKRRGVAGDLVVFRAAGWAAAKGHTLDEVWELAARANHRTRTLGVAFSGCTLPGADHPLFTVAPGTMSVGMGIHGEPGIAADQPLLTASELAGLLAEQLLASRPLDLAGKESKVAVIFNGLGSVKYEELFLTYGFIADRLTESGLVIVAPEVGELITSFEMAGVSLTLSWLDEDLEQAWLSPTATPAFRRGVVVPDTAHRTFTPQNFTPPGEPRTESIGTDSLNTASIESQVAAKEIVAALQAIRDVIKEQADELGRIDAIAGDGDHGIGMQRGSAAGYEAAKQVAMAGGGAGSTLLAAADAWADRAGGSSGALWGIGLRAVAANLGDGVAPDGQAFAAGVRAACEEIMTIGKAHQGDKTMVDALIPFANQLSDQVNAGASLAEAWHIAAAAATIAAEATAQLEPRIGRARSHAGKSLGTPDPGAVSLALAVSAVSATCITTEGRST